MASLRLVGLVSAALAIASISGSAQRTTGDQSSRTARTAHELSVEARLAARKRQCVSALGNAVFCDCLNRALPLDVSFQRYITIMTTDDADRDAPERTMARVILAARNACVASVFPETK